MSIAVELDQVTCRDADQALNGVSVAVPAGKLTIVTGSGRNLFMRVATGLSAPEFGTVRLGGRVLTGLNASARARVRRERAGMMLEPELLTAATVRDNILLPLRLAGRPVGSGLLAETAAFTGVADLLARPAHDLTGEQRRRVALARALITDPAAVFAFDPTSGLPEDDARKLTALLRAVVTRRAGTVVAATRDPHLAGSGDRLVVVHGGQTVEEIGPENVARAVRRMSTREG